MHASVAETQETPVSAAVAQINSGDLAAAETAMNDLIRREPNHPVGLYLLGLIAFERGHWSEAEIHLRRALSLSPGQPKIILLLARTLRALARADEALAICRSAPSTDIDIKLESAKCEEAIGNFATAEQSYRALLPLEPSYALHLAEFLCRMSRPGEAEAISRKALAGKAALDDTVRSQMSYQLGVTLKLQHRYEEALSEMGAASKAGILDRVQVMERAGLSGQFGRFEEASKLYEAFLTSDPSDLEVHALLNDLYHVMGKEDRIGTSYDMPPLNEARAAHLQAAKGRLFLKRGDLQKAEAAFRTALRQAPGDASILAGLAHTLDELGDRKSAHEIHSKNVTINPADGIGLEACGRFLLRHGDPEEATEMLSEAVRVRPQSQSGLALLGLAYRACNDPREQWLNDYDRDVQIFDLAPPQGYRDMESFNTELSAYLAALHGGARQYPSQTLRGGTQTYEEIFYHGHHLVDLLLVRINAALQAYRAHLTGRDRHPFASRLGRSFRHIGSWSSCLRDSGYHVNHIHQKGWISSCYYVTLPEVMADASAKQGWLKFGEPPAEFGLDWPARKVVQPVAGRLVLFPSYMWHGTLAFHSSEPRITIAFDTVSA